MARRDVERARNERGPGGQFLRRGSEQRTGSEVPAARRREQGHADGAAYSGGVEVR